MLKPSPTYDRWIWTAFLVIGALLAYVDNRMNMHTLLVEGVHAIVVTALWVFCLVVARQNPEIRKYGWSSIVWGVFLLMIGSWVDLLDDPPTLNLIHIWGVPFGRSWEQAFIKKILGYSVGILLMAYGFSQWVPWMIGSRQREEALNTRLSQSNKQLSKVLTSRDDHVESERLRISRELHDDVAQQLTSLKIQMQLCQQSLQKGVTDAASLFTPLGESVSEILKSVRQISANLRPESLYALGLTPALEQFLERLRPQYPQVTLSLSHVAGVGAADWEPLDAALGDRALLHVFRLGQEGVRNALKHAQASHVQIILTESKDTITLSVQDDGKGLAWTEPMPSDDALVREGHLGVVGMKERVQELDGTFTLANRPEGGSVMTVVVPRP